MADNNIRSTNQRNRRRSLRTRGAKNTTKPTIQSKSVLPTSGNKALEKKVMDGIKKLQNSLKVKQRRTYMADTIRAGADEFNNTNVRAKKGGPAARTGDVAKFNRAKKIKASAKGIGKGNMAANVLSLLIGTAADRGMLGKKVQGSYREFNNRTDQVLQPGFFK